MARLASSTTIITILVALIPWLATNLVGLLLPSTSSCKPLVWIINRKKKAIWDISSPTWTVNIDHTVARVLALAGSFCCLILNNKFFPVWILQLSGGKARFSCRRASYTVIGI